MAEDQPTAVLMCDRLRRFVDKASNVEGIEQGSWEELCNTSRSD